MLTFSFTLVMLNLNVFSFGDFYDLRDCDSVHTVLYLVYESTEINGDVLPRQTGD